MYRATRKRKSHMCEEKNTKTIFDIWLITSNREKKKVQTDSCLFFVGF